METLRRIRWAFAILVFFNIIVAISASVGINRVVRDFGRMYYDRLEPVLMLQLTIEQLYQDQLALKEYISSKDEKLLIKLESSMRERRVRIDSLIAAYRETDQIADAQMSMKQFQKLLAKYRAYEAELLQLSRNGQTEAAVKLLIYKVNPVFKDCVEPLHVILDLERREGKKQFAIAEADGKIVRTISYIILALTVLASIIFAVFVGVKSMKV